MVRLPLRSRELRLQSRSPLILALAAVALSGGSYAFAQGAGCDEFAGTLDERRNIVQRLSGITSKKQVDLKAACAQFTGLVTNGTKALKWLDANKDWCQIPEPFVENIRNDHKRATGLKGQACGAAAQQAAMEKKARAAAQQGAGGGGSGGLLGGEGLTGSFKLPQGAM